MVVHQHDRGGAQFKRTFDHVVRIPALGRADEMTRQPLGSVDRLDVLRDNLDENGASIWMRPGGRAERQLTMAAVLARLLIDAERQSASAFSVFLIVAWAAGRPRPRFRSRASRRR